jgi:uncharacterized CHY-type Zn-finger protein
MNFDISDASPASDSLVEIKSQFVRCGSCERIIGIAGATYGGQCGNCGCPFCDQCNDAMCEECDEYDEDDF